MNRILKRSINLSRKNSEYFLSSKTTIDKNKKEIIKSKDLANQQIEKSDL